MCGRPALCPLLNSISQSTATSHGSELFRSHAPGDPTPAKYISVHTQTQFQIPNTYCSCWLRYFQIQTHVRWFVSSQNTDSYTQLVTNTHTEFHKPPNKQIKCSYTHTLTHKLLSLLESSHTNMQMVTLNLVMHLVSQFTQS